MGASASNSSLPSSFPNTHHPKKLSHLQQGNKTFHKLFFSQLFSIFLYFFFSLFFFFFFSFFLLIFLLLFIFSILFEKKVMMMMSWKLVVIIYNSRAHDLKKLKVSKNEIYLQDCWSLEERWWWQQKATIVPWHLPNIKKNINEVCSKTNLKKRNNSLLKLVAT